MQHLETCFVSTCDVVNCLFPLDVQNETGVLSGADIQKSRSSGIVMLAGKYGFLDKKLAGN